MRFRVRRRRVRTEGWFRRGWREGVCGIWVTVESEKVVDGRPNSHLSDVESYPISLFPHFYTLPLIFSLYGFHNPLPLPNSFNRERRHARLRGGDSEIEIVPTDTQGSIMHLERWFRGVPDKAPNVSLIVGILCIFEFERANRWESLVRIKFVTGMEEEICLMFMYVFKIEYMLLRACNTSVAWSIGFRLHNCLSTIIIIF